MTKLLEWLCGITVYLGVWLALLSKENDLNLDWKWSTTIKFFPLLSIIIFGVYSLTVILWRVYCFNDCPEAAKELQEQIVEAREDLKKKGLKF